MFHQKSLLTWSTTYHSVTGWNLVWQRSVTPCCDIANLPSIQEFHTDRADSTIRYRKASRSNTKLVASDGPTPDTKHCRDCHSQTAAHPSCTAQCWTIHHFNPYPPPKNMLINGDEYHWQPYISRVWSKEHLHRAHTCSVSVTNPIFSSDISSDVLCSSCSPSSLYTFTSSGGARSSPPLELTWGILS